MNIVQVFVERRLVSQCLYHYHGHAVHISLDGASTDMVWMSHARAKNLWSCIQEFSLDAVLNLPCPNLLAKDGVELWDSTLVCLELMHAIVWR